MGVKALEQELKYSERMHLEVHWAWGLRVAHGSLSWPDKTFTSMTSDNHCKFLKSTTTWLNWSLEGGVQNTIY